MTCESCIHKKLCVIRAFPSAFENTHWEKEPCDHFKDESKYVELPCKVGDTVFIIDEGDEGSEPYVLDVVITAYGYDVSGFWATLNLPMGLKMSAHFGERMFGKTVFLTREEAEQALKGEPNG